MSLIEILVSLAILSVTLLGFAEAQIKSYQEVLLIHNKILEHYSHERFHAD